MSTRDLVELRGLLSKLERIVTEADRFAELEDEFMMMIAHGTHNALIVAMYTILHKVRRHPNTSATRRQTMTPDKIRKTQQLLSSLYQAIEARNVETAVELITLHVSTAHEEMIYEAQ
jgi:DNA-binding GntR family transcriptional regulator